jgi:hypothetical protein
MVDHSSPMTLELVHRGETLKVPIRELMTKCNLFADDPSLVAAPYSVRAPVSIDDFRQFVSVLEDKAVEVTNANFGGLSLLCDEFRFESLSERLSAFRQSPDFKAMMEDSEARLCLSAQRQTQKSTTAALTDATVRQNSCIEALETRFQASLEAMAVRLSRVEAELERESQAQKSTTEALTDAIARLSRIEAQSVRTQSVPPAFGSKIISELPKILAEFRGKKFSLLWRGSRDGFRAADFHRLCDGHANTLTLVKDTNRNIFGGFTPVEWESRVWVEKWGMRNDTTGKADPSLKSFLFTLRNPHNVPARRFELMPEWKNRAINCVSGCGPVFGANLVFCGGDLAICDNCDACAGSFSSLGITYTNDSGYDGATIFSGSSEILVQEIEVFEITD